MVDAVGGNGGGPDNGTGTGGTGGVGLEYGVDGTNYYYVQWRFCKSYFLSLPNMVVRGTGGGGVLPVVVDNLVVKVLEMVEEVQEIVVVLVRPV